jgi:phosphatidate cytidylyltransferase
MHLKRWLTGIIAIPTLFFIISTDPGEIFYAFLYIISMIGLIEFYGMTTSDLPRLVRWSIYLLALFLFFAVYNGKALFVPFIIVLWAFIPLALFMLTHPSPRDKWTADIGKALLGAVYTVIPFTLLVHIHRYCPEGKMWVIFLVTVIFSSDTGAFYLGKSFGRHKLYEAISPQKTWEGAFGGLLGSLGGVLLFLYGLDLFFAVDFHALDSGIMILALSMSLAGQIGDLAESMLKRNHSVKDSGRLFPGHGGVLDRIDGILFAIPILYMYLSL